MNDVDAAIGELDRAIEQLGLRGVQIYTDVQGRPLDDPRFAPDLRQVAELDIPILLHPGARRRPGRLPHRGGEPLRHLARHRLAVRHGGRDDAARLLRRLRSAPRHQDRHAPPRRLRALRRRAHPRGVRQAPQGRARQERAGAAAEASVTSISIEFYADTITIGSVPALRCGLDFFGVDRVHVRHRHAVRHAGRPQVHRGRARGDGGARRFPRPTRRRSSSTTPRSVFRLPT